VYAVGNVAYGAGEVRIRVDRIREDVLHSGHGPPARSRLARTPLSTVPRHDSARARYLRACHTGSGEARNRNTLRGKYSTRTRGCQTGECVSVTLIRKATRRQSRAVSSVHRRANSATNVVVIDELANPRHNTANQNPAEPFRRQTASEGAPRWRSLARFCAGLDGQGALRTRGR
jgi:hypothetical protein